MATARTANDVIDAALRLLGVLGTTETSPAADATLALEALQDLIAEWSGDGLIVPAVTVATFNLIQGTVAYTVGEDGGASLNTTRPERVLSCYVRDTNVDYPVRIIGEGQYQIMADKGTTQARPTDVWINYTAPLVTMTFWPEPDAADAFYFSSLRPITEPVVLTSDLLTTYLIPRNFYNAMKFNLARDIGSYFGRDVPPTIIRRADATKLALMSQNAKLRREPTEFQEALAIMGLGGAK